MGRFAEPAPIMRRPPAGLDDINGMLSNHYIAIQHFHHHSRIIDSAESAYAQRREDDHSSSHVSHPACTATEFHEMSFVIL
jgi:bacterioferritin (cytochrome b1)